MALTPGAIDWSEVCACGINWSYAPNVLICYYTLSYDIASGSEILPCNKINKPLVAYRFKEPLWRR